MLYLSPLLFIITAVVLLLTMLTFKKLGGLSRKFYREQQAALGAVNGAVQEDIEGLKVVKAFTREDATKAEFEVLNENYRVAASKATTYSMALMPISAQLNNVAPLACAALIPVGESSNMIVCSGVTLKYSIALRNPCGSGLAFVTFSAVRYKSKLSCSPNRVNISVLLALLPAVTNAV